MISVVLVHLQNVMSLAKLYSCVTVTFGRGKTKILFWGYNGVESGESLLSAYFMLVSCLAYSLTVKMEVIYSPKRWMIFTGLHSVILPDDTTLVTAVRSLMQE
jgi:hypothetical protein